MAEIVRAGMDWKAAIAHIGSWTKVHIDAPDRERLREIAESEILSLHEGNFARYRIRPADSPKSGAGRGDTIVIDEDDIMATREMRRLLDPTGGSAPKMMTARAENRLKPPVALSIG